MCSCDYNHYIILYIILYYVILYCLNEVEGRLWMMIQNFIFNDNKCTLTP